MSPPAGLAPALPALAAPRPGPAPGLPLSRRCPSKSGSTPTSRLTRLRPNGWRPSWPRCATSPSTATRTGPPGRCGRRSANCTVSPPNRSLPPTVRTRCLQSVCLAYGGPGRKAAMFEPTYALHAHIAHLTGTELVQGHRRPDFTLDVSAALELVEKQGPSIVFLCSPNNPTGLAEDASTVSSVVAATDGLVRGGRGLRPVRLVVGAGPGGRGRPPGGGAHLLQDVVDGRVAPRLPDRAVRGRPSLGTRGPALPPGRHEAGGGALGTCSSRPKWSSGWPPWWPSASG